MHYLKNNTFWTKKTTKYLIFIEQKENLNMLEHEFMVNVNDSLGQMKFVFDWPQLYFADPYKVKMFTETYYYFTDDSVKEKLSNYLKIFIVPDRMQEEIDTYNARKLTMERE